MRGTLDASLNMRQYAHTNDRYDVTRERNREIEKSRYRERQTGNRCRVEGKANVIVEMEWRQSDESGFL